MTFIALNFKGPYLCLDYKLLEGEYFCMKGVHHDSRQCKLF